MLYIYMFINLTNKDPSEILFSVQLFLLRITVLAMAPRDVNVTDWLYVNLNASSAEVSDFGLDLQTVAINLLNYSV
jgi:hypothetical protein